MSQILESIKIESAIREFEYNSIYYSSKALLRALGYPILKKEEPYFDSVLNFIYFCVPQRKHLNFFEISFIELIEDIQLISEISNSDLFDINMAEKLYIIAVELKCNINDRSIVSHYITKILSNLYDSNILLIFKNHKFIEFSTIMDSQIIYLSNWINVIEPSITDMFLLFEMSLHNVLGINNISTLYQEISYIIARDYQKNIESLDYLIYEYYPKRNILINEFENVRKTRAEFINDLNEYLINQYGYDYITIDESVDYISNDIFMESQIEEILFDDEIDFDDENDLLNDSKNIMDNSNKELNYANISDEILSDPIEMLKWIEESEGQKNGY